MEEVVWQQVVNVLQQPELIENEYKRRLGSGQVEDASHLQNEQAKLRSAIARMIDSYADGIIEKNEFEPRVKQARGKLARVEAQLRSASESANADQQLRLLILHLGDFSSHVLANLQTLDFDTKRNVIRALVKRVEIDCDNVNVIFRIGGMQMPKTAAG